MTPMLEPKAPQLEFMERDGMHFFAAEDAYFFYVRRPDETEWHRGTMRIPADFSASKASNLLADAVEEALA